MYRILSLSKSFKSKNCTQSFSWFSRIEEYFKENNVKLIPDVRDIFEDPPPIDMLKGTKSWITVNDKDYGGTSELTLARDLLVGALHLKGKINMPSDIRAKGGFVSIRGKYKVNLMDYYGFEIKVKNNLDKPLRATVNLQCDSVIENDLYQVNVEFLAQTTSMIRIPFSDFALTSFGYEREVQRLSDKLQVESIGFLLTSQSQLRKISEEAVGSTAHHSSSEQQQENEEEEEEDLDDEIVRKSMHFDIDLEILSITALSYQEDAVRKLNDRKNYLRHNNQQKLASEKKD